MLYAMRPTFMKSTPRKRRAFVSKLKSKTAGSNQSNLGMLEIELNQSC
jgi:hypothetical protein